MVAHIVMWRIGAADGNSKEENIQLVKQRLEALPPIIAEISDYEIGVNTVQSDRSYDIVLVSRFQSWKDLDVYRVHPEHVKVADFIGSVKEHGAVVDYEY